MIGYGVVAAAPVFVVLVGFQVFHHQGQQLFQLSRSKRSCTFRDLQICLNFVDLHICHISLPNSGAYLEHETFVCNFQ